MVVFDMGRKSEENKFYIFNSIFSITLSETLQKITIKTNFIAPKLVNLFITEKLTMKTEKVMIKFAFIYTTQSVGTGRKKIQ